MGDRVFFGLTLFATIACAVMAGTFFIFSIAIMAALKRLPPAQGIKAMQMINVVIVSPLFLLAFLGAGIAGIALIVRAIAQWGDAGTSWLLSGSVLYIIGGLVVSFAFNIPRNDALDRLDPDASDAPEAWETYVSEWTMWNHVRTVLTIAATLAFVLSLNAD